MLPVARFISAFSAFIGKACIPLYAACIVLSALEVFMRYVMGSPTQWTFEIVMALCASAWLLSAGYVTQRHAHISISSFTLLLPRRQRFRLTLFNDLVGAVALGILAYSAFEPAHMAVMGMERTGSAFNPPMPAYLKALLVAASGLAALQMLSNFVLGILGRDTSLDEGGEYGD